MNQELSRCCGAETWEVSNSKLLRCSKCKNSFSPQEQDIGYTEEEQEIQKIIANFFYKNEGLQPTDITFIKRVLSTRIGTFFRYFVQNEKDKTINAIIEILREMQKEHEDERDCDCRAYFAIRDAKDAITKLKEKGV